MADLMACFTNKAEDHPAGMGRKIISAAHAPRGEARAALEGRRVELIASLKATPGEDLKDVLYALLATGETYGASGDETDIKVGLYAEALRDVPTWAVDQARQAFGRPGWKSGWNGRGIPQAHEVVSECRHIIQPIEAELYRIGQILDAEVVDLQTTPAEREQAIAAWAAIRAGIASHNVIAERTPEEIDRERSAMRRANDIVRQREARSRVSPSPSDLPTA